MADLVLVFVHDLSDNRSEQNRRCDCRFELVEVQEKQSDDHEEWNDVEIRPAFFQLRHGDVWDAVSQPPVDSVCVDTHNKSVVKHREMHEARGIHIKYMTETQGRHDPRCFIDGRKFTAQFEEASQILYGVCGPKHEVERN